MYMYLEVGVGIDAEPVGCRDHGIVGRVDPGRPRVDVANGDPRQGRAGDGVPDLLDVADEDVRADPRVLLVEEAGGRDAVEVLGADRDAGDEAAELGAVGGDGGLQGGDLVGKVRVPGRGPQAQQERGLGADRRGDGLDGAVGGAALLEWGWLAARVLRVSETLQNEVPGMLTKQNKIRQDKNNTGGSGLTTVVYRRAELKTPGAEIRPWEVLNSASKSLCTLAAPVVKVEP